MTAPLANNTEALFHATVGLNIAFAFAHHVFTPHYHHDASIEVEISCSVRNEPAARGHAMGVDVVDLRHSMDALISKHLGHRLVVWGPELSQARSMALDVEPGSIAPPPLDECVFPVRPTLEALSAFSLLLTEVSLADLAPTDAAVTSLLFRETPRSFVRLSTDQLPAARKFAAESFRDMLSL